MRLFVAKFAILNEALDIDGQINVKTKNRVLVGSSLLFVPCSRRAEREFKNESGIGQVLSAREMDRC